MDARRGRCTNALSTSPPGRAKAQRSWRRKPPDSSPTAAARRRRRAFQNPSAPVLLPPEASASSFLFTGIETREVASPGTRRAMETPFIYCPRTGNGSSTPRPQPPSWLLLCFCARARRMLTFCFFFVLTAISLDLVCMRAVEDELIMAALEGNLGRIKGIPASIDSLFLPHVQLLRGCVLACLIN
jgi:hypothetical protein